MQAIRVHQFGGPEVMQMEEVEMPVAGAGQVVIAVKAIGVNPLESYIRAGTYAMKPQLPYTPGTDAAGVVHGVGAGVSEWKAGDRVYTAGTLTGAYAPFALCDAGQIFRLREKLSFAQGAAVYVSYTAAYYAMQKAQPRRGETILIHGASGGVGIAAIQLAKQRGLEIFATASSEEGRTLASKQGAKYVLDHSSAEHYEEIKTLTGGKGVEIILEMLANKNLNDDFLAAAKFGRVVIIGNRGTTEIDPRRIMGKELSIYGMTIMNLTGEQRAEIQRALAGGMAAGELLPVIDEEMPLAKAALAHATVMEAGSKGKIVLVP